MLFEILSFKPEIRCPSNQSEQFRLKWSSEVRHAPEHFETSGVYFRVYFRPN